MVLVELQSLQKEILKIVHENLTKYIKRGALNGRKENKK